MKCILLSILVSQLICHKSYLPLITLENSTTDLSNVTSPIERKAEMSTSSKTDLKIASSRITNQANAKQQTDIADTYMKAAKTFETASLYATTTSDINADLHESAKYYSKAGLYYINSAEYLTDATLRWAKAIENEKIFVKYVETGKAKDLKLKVQIQKKTAAELKEKVKDNEAIVGYYKDMYNQNKNSAKNAKNDEDKKKYMLAAGAYGFAASLGDKAISSYKQALAAYKKAYKNLEKTNNRAISLSSNQTTNIDGPILATTPATSSSATNSEVSMTTTGESQSSPSNTDSIKNPRISDSKTSAIKMTL